MVQTQISQLAVMITEFPIPRPTVCVLLIDTDVRTLLFCSINDGGGRYWFPPGGAVEPGENVLDTAKRELNEETGRANFTIETEMGFRRHRTMWRDRLYEFQELWYLARTEPFEVDTSGFEDLERESIHDHRWWSLDELKSSADDLVPRDLASLVEEIVRNGPPSSPIELGI